jgi:hypothetical protein
VGCKKQKFLISLKSLWGHFGRFWPFLGLEKGVNFFWLIFRPKTDWGHTLGKIWG